MPGTYTHILIHLVFSTKNRERWIREDIASSLYGVMGAILRDQGSPALAIGGVEDHVHLLISYTVTNLLPKVVQAMKAKSSRWLHESYPELADFAWQEGYAAFSVSESQAEKVKAYISKQREHHRKRDFRAELAALLTAHGVKFDPQYALD